MAELILHKQKEIDSAYITACLIRFCGHDHLQAEQCALIVQLKGKYSIKNGNIDDIYQLHESFESVGLETNINNNGSNG